MTRLAHPIVRLAALILLALGLSVSTAAADTLMMPKRDALKGTSFVVWGVTTLPNGSSVSIDFDDGNPPTLGTVTDRSYITFNKSYTVSGVKTIAMTVTSGATTEVATVAVQVFDPALLTADNQRSVKINMAIEDGLRYLWLTQSNRINFSTTNFANWGRASWTALVVLAFENHGYQLPNNNTAPTGLYERFVVRRGLNTLMNGFATLSLNAQPAGNPCAGAAPAAEFGVSSTCVGYYSSPEGIGLAGYANALMILPFAGSGAFNRTNTEAGGVTAGKSFAEITQRLVNAMAWGQNDPASGNARGGWNYGFNENTMDGSTAGWNILAILDAEAGGIALPTFLKSEFAFGINKSFNTNGSFDYNADNNPAFTVPHPALQNVARAGIGAQALFMIGSTAGGAQGLATQKFISDRWNGAFLAGDYNGTCNTVGNNKGCAYSMFNVFKGLKLLGVTTLPGVTRPAGPGTQPAGDWYADYQDYLVTSQQAPATVGGGHWNMQFSCCTNSTEANVAIAELILSPVALVLPATVTLSPTTDTAPIGGTHTVTAKAESTGGTPVPGATVTFTVLTGPNTGATGSDTTDSAGLATFTYTDVNAGTDTIRANIGTLNSNTVSMIWTKRDLTLNFTAADKVYDGGAAAVITGCTLTGVQPADIGGVACDYSGATASFVDVNVGNSIGVNGVGFTLVGPKAGNYVLQTIMSATANITPAPVTATAGSGSSVYDGVTHTASSCSVAGIYVGDLACTNNPATAGPNVGTTVMSALVSGSGLGNYSITSVDGSYVITAAPVTITAGSGSSVYDGATHAPSACTVAGAYTGDLACTNNPATVGPDVSTTPTTPVITGTGFSNYDITTVGGSYEITLASSTTVVTCTPSVVYTGSPIAVCSAVVTGAGGLNAPVMVSYTDNVNVGTANASATYGGDPNHTGSTGTSTFAITAAPTSASVSAPTVTYAANGVVTVAVTSGSGTVLGNVSLTVDGGPALTQTLSGGSATFTLTSPNAGDHALVATYAAQGNFQASSATGNLHVNKSPTATTLTSTPSSQAVGQPVTMTATVVAVAPGSGVPNGIVTFMDDSTTLGTATVNGSGVAVFTTTSLAIGPHSITATYSGSSNYFTSAAGAVSQLIYGYPTGGGTFVIGDNNDNLGASVTFWGGQWNNLNSMTGGPGTSSFKGFATGATPPVVGGIFTASPGNSGPAPAAVPEYIGIIVTSNVTKSGSNITGTIVRIVIVHVDPGYQSNPGHPGTGTVVAILP